MDDAAITKAKTALRALGYDELQAIIPFYKNLLSNARRNEALDNIAELSPGDKVVLQNIRPAHMNGSEGVVIRLKQTKVVCKFPGTRWSDEVTVPASCLTKVA